MKKITQIDNDDGEKEIRKTIKVLLKANLTLLPKKETDAKFKKCLKFCLLKEEYETAAKLRDKLSVFKEPYNKK